MHTDALHPVACCLPFTHLSLSHPSYLSSSAWTFRIFLGRHQCKCCDPPFFPPRHLGPFHFHLNPIFTFTSAWQLRPSSLPPAHPLCFRVSLCVGSCKLFLHVCESNQRAPLTGANLKHSNLSKLQILSFVLTQHLLHHLSSSLTPPHSDIHCLDVTVCSVTRPILSFSSTPSLLSHPSPCSIPPVSPAPAVHGGHHINPAPAQEELKCLWHRRSG